MLTDDFRAYPKSESRPHVAFCTDERLEQRLPDLRFNPGSSVRNGQTNAGTRAVAVLVRVRDPKLQRAAPPYGIQSIPNQVQDHLAEFTGHGKNRRAFAEIPFNDDLGVGQSRLIQGEG